MKNRFFSFVLVSVLTAACFSQNPAPSEKSAPAEKSAAPAAQQSATPQPKAVKPDRGQAYYHYALAHMYEELVSSYARSEFADKAIEEYKLAIQYDPDSAYLNSGLAELYAKTGRIRDAVLEAQEIIKRDPKNVEARRLLGRIYLRSLGDLQSGTQSQQMLKLAIEQFQQIVTLDPAAVDDHLLLGRLYRLDNNMLAAEKEFKTAVQLQPDSEDALINLAYLYTEEGDNAKAVQTLEGVAGQSDSARLYAALGYTYEQNHEYKKAISAYRRSLELDKDNLDSMRGLAQNLYNDGQMEPALAEYKSIAEADPQDPQAQLRIAEIYRQTGQFDSALDYLRRAQSLVQDSFEVNYNIALVYEAQGRNDDAAQVLQDLVAKTEKADGKYTSGEANNHALFLEHLGNIYRDQGKYQLAIATYQKILPLGSDQAERGYEQIVETYRTEKMWGDALNEAQEAVSKQPNSRELKKNLALQLADNGKGPEAVALVRSLIKNDSTDYDLYLALAQINTSLRHFKDAEDAAAQAEKLASKPDDKEFTAFVAGSVFEREKKYDLAEQKFKSVLTDDPRNAAVLNYLGYMLADRGLRLQEALGYIQKAVAQEPQNGAYLDSLGWVYYKLGNYDLAEANVLKASEKMGNDGTIQDHLAEIYFKTDRLKQAVAHWERALTEWNRTTPSEVDPTDVARVQKELESARVKIAQEGETQQK